MATQTKRKTYERPIAERFIELLGEGWQIDEARDFPDFHLRRGKELVGLELARYREQGTHNETHDRNWAMCDFIGDHWIEDGSVNHYHLYLSYRNVAKDRISVPRRSEWSAVVEELRRAVLGTELPADGSYITVAFVTDIDEKALALRTHFGVCPARRADYPVLSKHFNEIKLTYQPELVFGRPHTSASARCTAADTDEVHRVIGEHLLKVPGYRGSLPKGAQLWFVIHSDGWPPAAHIANDRIRDELYAVATAAVTAPNNDRFDAVWWLDDAYVRDNGTLHRIA